MSSSSDSTAFFLGTQNVDKMFIGFSQVFPFTPTIPLASGGDEIWFEDGYWYHRFDGSGSFVTDDTLICDILVASGGGAGGQNGMSDTLTLGGGYGGGGGALDQDNVQVGAGSHPITVGSAGTTTSGRGNNGGVSSAFSLSPTGGGGGGLGGGTTTSRVGRNGGCGGGGAYGSGAPGAGGSGVPGQGNDGGEASDSVLFVPHPLTPGGRGGGAGEPVSGRFTWKDVISVSEGASFGSAQPLHPGSGGQGSASDESNPNPGIKGVVVVRYAV